VVWRLLVTGLAALLFSCDRGGQDRSSNGAPPTPKVAVEELIKDFRVASSSPYAWAAFSSDLPLYTDRNYSYVGLPFELGSRIALRTANEDKFSPESKSDFITFVACRRIRVSVIYTDLQTRLAAAWLTKSRGWELEPLTVETTLFSYKSTRLVRSRSFAAGERVSLGGNGCRIENCDMYTVVVALEG
jgi:hypothetical protein